MARYIHSLLSEYWQRRRELVFSCRGVMGAAYRASASDASRKTCSVPSGCCVAGLLGVEEVEREGCRKGCVGGDAGALLGDGGGLKKLLERAIGRGGREAGGGSSGEGQEEAEAGGLALGDGRGGCDLDHAELKGASPAEAGEEGGVRFKGQGKAEDVDGSAFGEGETDLSHAPGDREERNFGVVLSEEGGASEGQGGSAVTVENGVDLFGGGGVGDGDGVVANLGNADGASLTGEAVDGVSGVGFAG
uniref:Uncharacterized protein n=1 Tax=mine drainage metagenome TaxID=410659 RepID=E6PWS1_9ZZZZ